MDSNLGKNEDIKLPFEREDFDVGVWSYDHRAGLLISIIIYLLIAIGFVLTKISVATTKPLNTIVVDLEQLEDLHEEKKELEQQIEKLEEQTEALSKVNNAQSNEASEEMESSQETVEDTQPSDEFQEILEEFERTQREMAANRELLEQEAQIEKPVKTQAKNTAEESKPRRDKKERGNVTVSYAIVNPIRHAVDLKVPSYMCEKGGKVVINVEVNKNGYVTDAKVWRSTGDFCIEEAALNAALSSRFDFNAKASNAQKGKITYLFVAQY